MKACCRANSQAPENENGVTILGFFQNFRTAWKAFWNRAAPGNRGMELMQVYNSVGLYNGTLYDSDVVRSIIRPYVKAMGKLQPKHIRTKTDRDGNQTTVINPDVYINMVQNEPNPYMTGQMFREWMATQKALNGNAFAAVIRDANGLPIAKYPILATAVQARYEDSGALYLTFSLRNGKMLDISYEDVIHLRGDYGEANDLFGASPAASVIPLLDVVKAGDNSIIQAIKNSAVIRWLLNFHSAMRTEDLDYYAKHFAEQFLDVKNGTGVAATDSKADAQQVNNNNYVPTSDLTTGIIKRLYSVWNTNEKIVMSSYSEDEWNAYYENVIQPDVQQLGEAETLRLFTRRQRALGDRMAYDAENLSTASMNTKLGLKEMVDRGAMTPNEWRATMHLASVEGGDTVIRRLDTAPVTEESDTENGEGGE